MSSRLVKIRAAAGAARTTGAARAALMGAALTVAVAGCAGASGSTAADSAAAHAKAMHSALQQKRSHAETLKAQKADLDAKAVPGNKLPDEGSLSSQVSGQTGSGKARGPKLPPRLRSGRPQRVHGTYVGPRNDGRNRCGYVSAGAGPQQASAFTLVGTTCVTARAVAAAAAHHELGSRTYSASGFSCRGTKSAAVGVLHYQCTMGRRSIRFVIS
jgi:hypothetical protein